MPGSMLRTADIEVNLAPVIVGVLLDEGLIVMGIHVPEVVGAGTREAWHGARLQRIAVICPVRGTGQRRFSRLGRLEFSYFREGQRKRLRREGCRDTVLVVDRERLSPVPLAGEYGVTQAVIDLPAADSVFLDISDRSRNRLLDIKPIQETGIGHLAGLGVETLL